LTSSERVKRLKESLVKRNSDAILIADEKNIYYFTEFLGGFRLLVPSDGENTLFVHSVNYEAAKNTVKNALVELIKVGERADVKILSEIKGHGFKSLGFDRLSAAEYLRMKDALKEVKMNPLDDVIWSLRKVKDDDELTLIKRAAELTSLGMKRGLEIIRPGLGEWEIAAEIEYEMRRMGSSGTAFDTIVCSGSDSAYPHGGSGERVIRGGEFVVIDIGAKHRGYCADMTRTIVVGEPSWRQKHMQETVKEAQKAAVKNVKHNVKAREVDGAARKVIAERGYGEYFVHSLGHGVGLDVHEPPTVGPTSEDVLLAGNVITIEPGIYIPGFGGVRVEDTFLITEDGATKLTADL